MNKAYLKSIRTDTCYPTFRAFVTVATLLTYLIAALAVVVGFVSGHAGGVMISIVIAALLALLAKVGQEVSLMIADIADATIDSAGISRQSATSQESLLKQSSAPSGNHGAKKNSEMPSVEMPSGPMGVCPNCESIIQLESETCHKCRAAFGPGSAWKIRPLT